LDPLEVASIDRKGPREDGDIVGAIAPPNTAVEIEEREGTVLLTGVRSMEIAMTQPVVEIG
jgi:hypothetical protein